MANKKQKLKKNFNMEPEITDASLAVIPKNLPVVKLTFNQTAINDLIGVEHPVLTNYPSLSEEQKWFILNYWTPDSMTMTDEQRVSRFSGISLPQYYRWMTDPNFVKASDEAFDLFAKTSYSSMLSIVFKKIQSTNDPRWMKLWFERFDDKYCPKSNAVATNQNLNINLDATKMDKETLDKLIRGSRD